MRKKTARNSICLLFALLFCFAAVAISELLFIDRYWNGAPLATWQCDAHSYWFYGEQLKNADFDFTVLDGFRGYVFPLFLGIINFFGGKNLWYIVNGFFLAIFAVMVVPELSGSSGKMSLKKGSVYAFAG